jgi:hypothetical protein
MTIKIKEEAPKDTYLDIVAIPQDACQKMRTIYFNLPEENHRKYAQGVLDDIASKMADYISEGQAKADKIKNNAMSSFPSGNEEEVNQEMIMSMPGVKESLESWNTNDVLSSMGNIADTAINGGGVTVSMDAINQATAGVEAGIDKGLNGLCQGFKLGGGGCQPPVPINLIPFNQAFLFPGKYHIF